MCLSCFTIEILLELICVPFIVTVKSSFSILFSFSPLQSFPSLVHLLPSGNISYICNGIVTLLYLIFTLPVFSVVTLGPVVSIFVIVLVFVTASPSILAVNVPFEVTFISLGFPSVLMSVFVPE